MNDNNTFMEIKTEHLVWHSFHIFFSITPHGKIRSNTKRQILKQARKPGHIGVLVLLVGYHKTISSNQYILYDYIAGDNQIGLKIFLVYHLIPTFGWNFFICNF